MIDWFRRKVRRWLRGQRRRQHGVRSHDPIILSHRPDDQRLPPRP